MCAHISVQTNGSSPALELCWSQVGLLLSAPCGTWGRGAVLGLLCNQLKNAGCMGEAGLPCRESLRKQNKKKKIL